MVANANGSRLMDMDAKRTQSEFADANATRSKAGALERPDQYLRTLKRPDR